jgi:hypothetical protein
MVRVRCMVGVGQGRLGELITGVDAGLAAR